MPIVKAKGTWPGSSPAPPSPESTVRIAEPLVENVVELSREQVRSRRHREVRARTVSMKRMTKRELELGRLLYPDDPSVARPKTRGDCVNGLRPCPFVSCKHHLYLDVSARTGAIKLNYPDLEPEGMRDSCVLDIADRGGETLESTGEVMNLTRERIRQVEVKALAKIQTAMATLNGGDDSRTHDGKRRLPMLEHVVEHAGADAIVTSEELFDRVDDFAAPRVPYDAP